MGLLRLATVPPPVVPPDATVWDAVERMSERNVGAVAVTRDDRLVGIFTERDLMNRVVRSKKDPDTTRIEDVMTRDVVSAKRDMQYGDALSMMVGRHFRHIPVVDDERRVLGILSVRDLYEHAVERLSSELNTVMGFIIADGPGGD